MWPVRGIGALLHANLYRLMLPFIAFSFVWFPFHLPSLFFLLIWSFLNLKAFACWERCLPVEAVKQSWCKEDTDPVLSWVQGRETERKRGGGGERKRGQAIRALVTVATQQLILFHLCTLLPLVMPVHCVVTVGPKGCHPHPHLRPGRQAGRRAAPRAPAQLPLRPSAALCSAVASQSAIGHCK